MRVVCLTREDQLLSVVLSLAFLNLVLSLIFASSQLILIRIFSECTHVDQIVIVTTPLFGGEVHDTICCNAGEHSDVMVICFPHWKPVRCTSNGNSYFYVLLI